MTRFVVCIDFYGVDGVGEAYRRLRKVMEAGHKQGLQFEWETSDEAYYDTGDRIDEDELQQAIVEVLDEEGVDEECAPILEE